MRRDEEREEGGGEGRSVENGFCCLQRATTIIYTCILGYSQAQPYSQFTTITTMKVLARLLLIVCIGLKIIPKLAFKLVCFITINDNLCSPFLGSFLFLVWEYVCVRLVGYPSLPHINKWENGYQKSADWVRLFHCFHIEITNRPMGAC